MRGRADGVGGGDWPARPVEAGLASLRAVDALARAIRARRAARAFCERRDADGSRRVVRAVLDTAATMPDDRRMVPADADRGDRW